VFEGIETGYEEKYDFPHRAGPPRQLYVLACAPRSGSTFLSHLLWQSGCLGAPLEYLNFLPTSPYFFVSGDPAGQIALWRSVLHRRTSPNGVFGLKCFPAQLRELQQANVPLCLEVLETMFPRGGTARAVRLKRRDRSSHAISLARALLSGIWRKEQEGSEGVRVAFSREAIDKALAIIDHQEREWDSLLGETRAEQLTLWYEDLLEDSAKAVGAVAAFLGIVLDPGAAVEVPEVQRQSQEDSRHWAQMYQSS
jgi:LPS sulfotransferase NodH